MYSIKSLSVYNVDIPPDVLESLSNSCNQLESIELKNVKNYGGLDTLIKANVNLISHNLELRPYTNASIFEILGLHCPLLQICRVEGAMNVIYVMTD